KIKLAGEDLPVIIGADALSSWKGQKYEVLEKMKGEALVGLEYEPVMPELPIQQDFAHKIVAWEDVDAKEGTGVVHTAPGCGREDFELSKKVELQVLCPVDERGVYTAGSGWLEGKNVTEVGTEVADYLEKNGKLFKRYMHDHSYPVCWRCKHELIFRLVDEWYISCDEIRPKMIEAAAEVIWQPDYVGKRMENWLQNMGDWCISRKRFWGLPLPFYPCKDCGTMTIVKSREELTKLSGNDLKEVPELHRPWIDGVQINCPKCSAKVSRVTEVGDCWLDAGIVPFSTRGYFESEEARKNWQRIDWICEMSEQVRLWFYSVLFMGVTLTGKSPYKRVLTHESVRAEDGSRFSKTGFMIRFDDAVEKMGADTMRYYFASESPLNDIRFGYNRGDDARRQVLSLWNIFTFFNTYAGIDKPDLASSRQGHALTDMDRWLLARTHDFVSKATAAYDAYNTPGVVREYETFVENVSNWYIRANRRRFWKSGSTEDKLAGYWSLFQALRNCLLVMSPIMPFLTEHMWQEAVRHFEPGAAESIHHASWPVADAAWADAERLRRASDAQAVINCAHRLRADAQIKVRQPLARLFVSAPAEMLGSLREMESLIAN
ncbi:MAG: class I tRNA ligase family protein, partial [Prosthecobacter sp.]|nr:class I tRNA ligase family protein [Prosthecobacter sp.]